MYQLQVKASPNKVTRTVAPAAPVAPPVGTNTKVIEAVGNSRPEVGTARLALGLAVAIRVVIPVAMVATTVAIGSAVDV